MLAEARMRLLPHGHSLLRRSMFLSRANSFTCHGGFAQSLAHLVVNEVKNYILVLRRLLVPSAVDSCLCITSISVKSVLLIGDALELSVLQCTSNRYHYRHA